MRIFTYILLALCFLSAPTMAREKEPLPDTYANENEIFDQAHVRGFIWGLPKEIIKAEEEATFVEESEDGTILFYYDVIRDMKVSINYEFEDNKLARVRIFSEERYVKAQERLDDFITIKRDLEKRFGPPEGEEFVWRDRREENFPERWANTILFGHLDIVIRWETTETNVTSFIGRPDKTQVPVMFVLYESVRAKQKREDALQKQREDAIRIIPQSY